MDRVEFYRDCVCKLLTAEVAKEKENPEIENQLIFDKERDRYLFLDVGWQDHERIYACFIHLDIRAGKIWIQRNMTELDIAEELVSLGVAKEDIIIGLLPPYQRPYTGYGTTDLATLT
ncbi:MAG: XisI protein [Cyanobacteria bacterium P01_E01_bin.42]